MSSADFACPRDSAQPRRYVACAMKIATWNVNSIRQREGHVQRWLQRVPARHPGACRRSSARPPPSLASTFHGLGYQAEAVGQKSYNGVAVLGRVPFTVTHRALPGLPEDDAQARYIEVEADGITVDRHLPAERQLRAARPASPTSWPGWTGWRTAPRRCWRPTRRSSSPATSTWRRPTRTSRPAPCRPPTPWSARKAAPASAACSGWA